MVGAFLYLRIGYFQEKCSRNVSIIFQNTASFQDILKVYSTLVVHLGTGESGYNPVSVLIGRAGQLFGSHVETILARGVPI